MITPSEFDAWVEFYKLNPFDDRALFYRPAALIATAASQGALEFDAALNILERKLATPDTDGWSDADLATFRSFNMKPPPRRQ